MATKGTVMAWGENGLEPTPVDQVVWIEELPLGPDNKVIPATIRALPQVFGRPLRLTGIRTKGCDLPLVTWRDESGKRASCRLRHEADARDPLFASLPASSRARLLAAVERV